MRANVADNGVRDVLNMLFKRQRLIAATLLLIVGAVAIYSFAATPLYEAKSTLLIKAGREYTYRPEVGEEKPPILLNREDLMNSEIEILMSRDLAAKVVERIGLLRLYPAINEPPPLFSLATVRRGFEVVMAFFEGREAPTEPNTAMDRATKAFLDALKVEAVAKSNVVRVTYRHPEPQLAAEAVQTLVDSYKAKRLEVFSGPKSAFLEEQLTYYRDQLNQAEQKFEAFRQKYGVYSLDQQRSLLLSQRNALDTELKATENRIEESSRRLASLQEQQKKISETVPLASENERYPVVDDAKSRLLALQLREQELLTKYREESQLVQNVREEKRVVEQFLARAQNDRATRVRTGKNPVYEQLEIEVVRTTAENNSLIAKKAAIDGQLVKLGDDLRALDLRDKELQQIERDIKNYRQNYETYFGRVEEARISGEMDQQKMVNVSVIEAASQPIRPIWPRKVLNIALALVFGTAAGLGLAFLAEYLGSGFVTPESAGRSLGVRVLGTVPYRST